MEAMEGRKARLSGYCERMDLLGAFKLKLVRLLVLATAGQMDHRHLPFSPSPPDAFASF